MNGEHQVPEIEFPKLPYPVRVHQQQQALLNTAPNSTPIPNFQPVQYAIPPSIQKPIFHPQTKTQPIIEEEVKVPQLSFEHLS